MPPWCVRCHRRFRRQISPRCSRCVNPMQCLRGFWRCSMRVDDLRGKRIAIWGWGREGRAALRFLRARMPGVALTVLDDAETVDAEGVSLVQGRAAIVAAIMDFDVVVKSPGISLYDPLVVEARARGVRFTSLL